MIGPEFDDALNHRVEVVNRSGRDKYGQGEFDQSTKRTYMCFVSHEESVARSATETNVNLTLIAYVKSIPIGASEPQAIPEDADITVTVPTGFPKYPISSIVTYYDSDGTDYVYEVRFGAGRIPVRG